MKSKKTKKALTGSVLALVLCFVMLLGTTFAWFTDTASTGVNKIQAGTLEIELLDENNESLEGRTLNFKKAEEGANQTILWEPGCTYELQPATIKNVGNLALKYRVTVTGINGDTKLNEAIEWTVSCGSTDRSVSETEYYLLPGDSATINISGHMDENAGNEYQGLSIESAFITVEATQYTYEFDSTTDQYDANAAYEDVWDGTVGTVPAADEDGVITITNAAQLAAFAQSVNNGTSYEGQTVKLATSINLSNKKWTPIGKNAGDESTAFKGVFDGNGYTISNLNVNGAAGIKGAGFFGYVYCGAVKNLTIVNATVKGYSYVAALVGSAMCTTIDNCHVNNARVTANTYLNGDSYDDGDKVGGIVGYFACEPNGSVTNCSVKNSTIVGYRDLGALIGYFNSYSSGVAVINNNSVSNVTIYQDNTHNYKSYTSDADYHVNKLIGYEIETLGGTNTANGVTLKMSTSATSSLPTTAATGDVVLKDDISGAAQTDAIYAGTKAGFVLTGGTFDGNGNTLTVGSSDWGIQTSGGTIKNVTIKNAFRCIMINTPTADVYIDNVTLDGGYGINTAEHVAKNLYVTNSTIKGWNSWAGLASANFTNCKLAKGSYWNSDIYDQYLRPYITSTFTNCDFVEGMNFDLSKLVDGATVTFTNCTCNGVSLTAENVYTYLHLYLDSDDTEPTSASDFDGKLTVN